MGATRRGGYKGRVGKGKGASLAYSEGPQKLSQSYVSKLAVERDINSGRGGHQSEVSSARMEFKACQFCEVHILHWDNTRDRDPLPPPPPCLPSCPL